MTCNYMRFTIHFNCGQLDNVKPGDVSRLSLHEKSKCCRSACSQPQVFGYSKDLYVLGYSQSNSKSRSAAAAAIPVNFMYRYRVATYHKKHLNSRR